MKERLKDRIYNMNLDILKVIPNLNKKAKLIIQPLAPLSMVSELPGTYYKNQDLPDRFKIAGLFENIMGWHFDKLDRKNIINNLKNYYEENFNEPDFDIDKSNSSYQPLLLNHFEIGTIFLPETNSYDDLWKRSFRRSDADVHPKGTPNLNYQTLVKRNENNKRRIKEIQLKINSLSPKSDKKEIAKLKEEIGKFPLLQFYKNNLDRYPMFYTSPTLREYTDYMGGQIQIGLTLDAQLLEILNKALESCSSAYLGNSEGWVEIKIEEL